MMKSKNIPKTAAVRMLTEKGVKFTPHEYNYIDRGGTKVAAESVGCDEHVMLKTLIFEKIDESNKHHPIIVLMHGDKSVSTKQLARFLNVKSVEPADTQSALKYTGYQVGGTSPFGTRQEIPVYAESTIFDSEKIWINGGKRGFLIEIESKVLKEILPVNEVNVSK
ncbi:YbaK/EbsC family protein [Bacteroidota bacterium]